MDKIKRLWRYLFVNPSKKKLDDHQEMVDGSAQRTKNYHSGECCKSVENQARKPLYGATTTSDYTRTSATASNVHSTFTPTCSSQGRCCYCKCGPNTGKEWVPKSLRKKRSK
jgi:hypothetical protein